EGEPTAAELLRDRDALQPKLFGHLLPHRGVEAGLSGHQLPHRRAGRLRGQEPAHRGAQLLLLRGEHELHRLPPTTGLNTRSTCAASWSTSHRSFAVSCRTGSGLLNSITSYPLAPITRPVNQSESTLAR